MHVHRHERAAPLLPLPVPLRTAHTQGRPDDLRHVVSSVRRCAARSRLFLCLIVRLDFREERARGAPKERGQHGVGPCRASKGVVAYRVRTDVDGLRGVRVRSDAHLPVHLRHEAAREATHIAHHQLTGSLLRGPCDTEPARPHDRLATIPRQQGHQHVLARHERDQDVSDRRKRGLRRTQHLRTYVHVAPRHSATHALHHTDLMSEKGTRPCLDRAPVHIHHPHHGLGQARVGHTRISAYVVQAIVLRAVAHVGPVHRELEADVQSQPHAEHIGLTHERSMRQDRYGEGVQRACAPLHGRTLRRDRRRRRVRRHGSNQWSYERRARHLSRRDHDSILRRTSASRASFK